MSYCDPLSKIIRSYHNTEIIKIDACYIGTNEQNLSMTEKLISEHQYTGCHLGVSGYFNFDVAWWGKSNRIIICDINPHQVIFLKQTLKIMCESNNRTIFFDRMTKYLDLKLQEHNVEIREKSYLGYELLTMRFYPNISNDNSYANDMDMDNQVKYELARKGSWLSNENSYNYIRKLALGDLIAVFCEDIRCVNVFQKLRSLFIENQIRIDTIYLSNVYDFLDSEDKLRYNHNIKSIINNDTLIIESEHKIGLYQTVVTGEKFLTR